MLQIHLKPVKDMYYDMDSNYGIFACEIVKENNDSKKVIYNNYGNFTVKGIMPKLEITKTYIAKVKEVKDKKYGLGYEVISIYEEELTTKEQQLKFLQAFLTERQLASIIEVYPNENIVELIERNEFEFEKVNGIGEATYQKIKEKILSNKDLQNVYASLQEYGLTHKMIRKLSEHYTSAQLLLEKIQENPYVLADEVNGIGFKKADLIALIKGIKKDSDYRLMACFKFILSEQANKGHVYVTEEVMKKNMREYLGIKTSLINDFLLSLNGRDLKDVYIEESRYALMLNYMNEVAIAEDIKRLIKHSYTIEVSQLEEKIQEIEINQGFDFTGDQREAIFSALETNVLLVNGKAGTGKTSVIKGIVNILKSAKEGYTYNTVALSGKASQRIKESTQLESSTIHRFLVTNPKNFNQFIHNRYNPIEIDLLIIDEASMINAYLFAKILEALKNGTKIVITGDYSQLEPIGAGNVFYDLCNSKQVTRIELTTVHRQAKKSGILSIANEIREGISSFEKDDYEKRDLGELKDLHFYPYNNADQVLRSVINIAKIYKKQEKNILKFQVITPMKKRGKICTFELNQILQNIFNPVTSIQQKVKKGKIEFREKDKVIHNGNNYNIGVLNGTIGIIERIDHGNESVTVNFETVGNVEISFSHLKDIDLSYALTVHRTQGSQFENCIIAIDYTSFVMLSRQLIYTAITRSIDHCYLICELKALLKAIKTDKSSNRNTFLSRFLSELQ
jgi:exodeoxyribonuclease V alpha subunit